MKKYYLVTFQYSESTYCSNIAIAETEEAVKAHYSKYGYVNIQEATESDIQEAKRKNKPFIKCETPEQEKATEENPKTSDRPNFADDLEKWTNGASASNKIIEAYNSGKITLFEALENIEKSHTEDARKDPDIIAMRIYNLDIFGNRDNDITPENIKTYIEADPLETILYLLDMVEEMQA